MEVFTFPILWINTKENSLGIFLDEDQLTTCAPGSQTFFNNLLLISSNGVIRQVENAVKIGRTNYSPKGFPRIFVWLGLGLIKVELKYKLNLEPLEFKDIKGLVIRTIKADEEFWDSDGNFDHLMKNVEASESLIELVETMKKRCWPNFSEKGGVWYKL